MLVVYVAGPFRGARLDDQWEQWQNIRTAEAAALEVWRAGGVALCPHMNTCHFQGALPNDTWLAGDLELLGRCDAILMVGHWDVSMGALQEREFAEAHDLPVFYSLEALTRWLKVTGTKQEAA